MIFTKEIAQKILDLIEKNNHDYEDKLKEAFENDPIWFIKNFCISFIYL